MSVAEVVRPTIVERKFKNITAALDYLEWVSPSKMEIHQDVWMTTDDGVRQRYVLVRHTPTKVNQ